MSTQFRIREFEPATAKADCVWLLIGARNTGKTVLLQDLLYNQRHNIHFPIAMTATVSTVQLFQRFMPHSLIYDDGYDFGKADNFLKIAEELVKANKTRHAALITDDVMYAASEILRSKTQSKLHMNGRHYHTAMFNTTQYAMSIPPQIRANCDYVFAMADPVQANRKRLHQQFFGLFATFQEFNRVFSQCTENYGCLVLDRTQSSGKLEDMVKWYKANPDLPPFKLGKPIFYRLPTMLSKTKNETHTGLTTKVIR